MNFRCDYFILVIISIIRKISSADLTPFSVCPNAPTNLETVHATVYFNGCTYNDDILFGRICSWRNGFSDNDVAITFIVGAEVTNENGKWTCMSSQEYDCDCTFKYACLSKILDQKTLFDFIYCAQKKGDYAQLVNQCITQFKLDQAVADCMSGAAGYDPKQIALNNSNEVSNKGVDKNTNVEPFIFFEQVFDSCTSDTACNWWAQSICKMLTEEKFYNLQNCQDAFGLGSD